MVISLRSLFLLVVVELVVQQAQQWALLAVVAALAVAAVVQGKMETLVVVAVMAQYLSGLGNS